MKKKLNIVIDVSHIKETLLSCGRFLQAPISRFCYFIKIRFVLAFKLHSNALKVKCHVVYQRWSTTTYKIPVTRLFFSKFNLINEHKKIIIYH